MNERPQHLQAKGLSDTRNIKIETDPFRTVEGQMELRRNLRIALAGTVLLLGGVLHFGPSLNNQTAEPAPPPCVEPVPCVETD